MEQTSNETRETAPRDTRESSLERWSPLGALLFIVGLVIVLASPAGGDTGETAEEVISYVDDAGNWIDYALVFGLAALLLLGWFVFGLFARLRRAGSTNAAVVALVAGAGFALLFFVAVTIWNAPLSAITDDDNPLVQRARAETYLTIDDIGWVTLGGAGISAGVMAMASSLAFLRAGWLPAWAGWIGVALGVISLATVAFFGIFAWMAWLVAAALWMLVARRRAVEQ